MPQLYARVFVQILDSSLAENWQTRHVFEDILKLPNLDGVVDMTRQALARRFNMPLEIVSTAIDQLERPDGESRDSESEGRRLVRLDEHRDWGWRIVNWDKYEKIRIERDMRDFNALRMANYRSRKSPTSPAPPTRIQKQPQSQRQSVDHNAPTCSLQTVNVAAPEGKRTFLKFSKPSLEEVQLVIAKIGLPETDGIWFWNKCEGNGWTNGGKPIRSWPHTIASWKAAGYMPSQKPNHANNQIPNTPKRYAQNPRNFGCIGDPARAAQKGADKIKREMDRMLAESAVKDRLAKEMAQHGSQQPENPSNG